ncbi:hypothetical protein Tco_0846961 [Tanacetum coccineum]
MARILRVLDASHIVCLLADTNRDSHSDDVARTTTACSTTLRNKSILLWQVIIKLKWLWKNKKDEDQTVIATKHELVAKVRILFAHSSTQSFSNHQMECENVHFLMTTEGGGLCFAQLKGTINMGLWYPKDSGFELTAFSDADHVGCLDTQKSTSGGIQFLGDKLEDLYEMFDSSDLDVLTNATA